MREEIQLGEKGIKKKTKRRNKPKNLNKKMLMQNINQKTNLSSGFDIIDEKSFSKFFKGITKAYPKLAEKIEHPQETIKDELTSIKKTNEVMKSIWRARDLDEGCLNPKKMNFCDVADHLSQFPMNNGKCKKLYEKYCFKKISYDITDLKKANLERFNHQILNKCREIFTMAMDIASKSAENSNKFIDHNPYVTETEPKNNYDYQIEKEKDIEVSLRKDEIDKNSEELINISDKIKPNNYLIQDYNEKFKWQSSRVLRKTNFLHQKEKKEKILLKERRKLKGFNSKINLIDLGKSDALLMCFFPEP